MAMGVEVGRANLLAPQSRSVSVEIRGGEVGVCVCMCAHACVHV